MNPVHLKTFVAVAELRHFARAASACNVSQPAVSHQIAQLETALRLNPEFKDAVEAKRLLANIRS